MNKIDKILDRIGSYAHLDLKYYVKNSFYLILAQIISIGMGLLFSVSFARFLSKNLYGQWNYILSIVAILATLTLPGMSAAVTQAVTRGHDGVLIEGIKEKFKWSILGSIAVFGVGIYYFLTGSVLLGKCFMISSLFFPFFENFQIYNGFLSGKKRFHKVAKYQVIAQVISVSVTVLIIYLSRNLMLILIAYLLSFSLIRSYFFRLTSKSMENESNDKEAITFGKHMTVISIPGQITAWGDKIIIGALLSFPELAIYSIAKSFSALIKSSMAPIAGLSFPKLSEMEEREAYSAVKKKYLQLVLLAVVICGVAIVLCPYIITFLYSQKYVNSVPYAQLLLVALIFGIPTTIFGKALFPAQRKVKELYKIQLFHTAIELCLLFALIFKFGLLGVIIAKVLSNLFVMIYSWKLAM